MPLDGITLNSVVQELSCTLTGGRVDKVQQPEPDEIIMAIRSHGQNHKLLLTASANSPRAHLTALSKSSPPQAPMFCMLLRKHLGGGRVIDIIQPDFERIVEFHIESPNEMGDLSVKRLVIEIMGKHSNIMLISADGVIMDSIRHVSREMSSVREVLPGRPYARPPSQGKVSPVPIDAGHFASIFDPKQRVQQAIYQSYNGISPIMASQICINAGVDADDFCGAVSEDKRERLFTAFSELYGIVGAGRFTCRIYEGTKRDFSAVELSLYPDGKDFESPSKMLEEFYISQDTSYRISQKTTDLRKLVQNLLERCHRKEVIHKADLKACEDREQMRHYGELLTAYIHAIPTGSGHAVVVDFYNENYDENNEIEIPLDPTMTPAENAQKYFKGYNKAKRAYAALQEQMEANNSDISYLDSVLSAISSAADESDIAEIRAELASVGFLKKQHGKKDTKKHKKSKPLHYRSSEGFDILVGKNNTQNDELTLRTAHPTDIWLHTKEIAGSHVIIRGGGGEVPEQTILEAALLAAYHSKGRNSNQVPVDYCPRKNVRKPKGSKPGFVIYDFYNTVYVKPDPEGIGKLERPVSGT